MRKSEKNEDNSLRWKEEDVRATPTKEVVANTCHEEGMEEKEEKKEVSKEEVAMNGEGKEDLLAQMLVIEEEWMSKFIVAMKEEVKDVGTTKNHEVNFDYKFSFDDCFPSLMKVEEDIEQDKGLWMKNLCFHEVVEVNWYEDAYVVVDWWMGNKFLQVETIEDTTHDIWWWFRC